MRVTILLAVLAGGALGFVLTRGDFCFHSTWRRLFAQPAETSLVRAYVVLLLVATPVVQVFIGTGFIDPFIPGFSPRAAVVGGAVFGAGMVIARTCISGMFYKLGAGMLGMVVAIIGWAIGDIVTWRGPLKGLREWFNENPITHTASDGTEQAATVTSALGPFGAACVIAIAIGLGAWVARDEAVSVPSHDLLTGRAPKLGGVRLGVAAGLVMVIAWVLVRWHGFDYSYGTSGVPSTIWTWATYDADVAWWIPLALLSVIPGALVAAVAGNTFLARGEEPKRYLELASGALVMGVGAGIAGGCNLGHSMVGVPLLSIGSIVTTVAIVGGVFVADRIARMLAH